MGDNQTKNPGDMEQCPICLKPVTTPATTPCKHLFCYYCLHDWAQKNRQVNEENGLVEASCPSCRQAFTSFKHHGNKTFKLFPPGFGPKGKLKPDRRPYPKRRQPY